ncbi:tetratricopeptide repeat protein, partial [Patescibacteria group bacterium]
SSLISYVVFWLADLWRPGVSLFSFSFAQSTVFNTIGTINALAIYLCIMVIFSICLWVIGGKGNSFMYKGIIGVLEQILIFVNLILALAILIIIDYWVLWLVLLAGLFFVFVLIFIRPKEFNSPAKFALPSVVAIIGLLFMFWLPSFFSLKAPIEVTPNNSESWSIAKQTLSKVSYLIGSGGGTYQFDYGQFHSKEINSTNFWQVRFDRGSSFFLTLLPTVGLLGTLAWLGLLIGVGVIVIRRLIRSRSFKEWDSIFLFYPAWLALVLASFVYNFNLTLLFLVFLFAALLIYDPTARPWVKSFGTSRASNLMVSFIFVALATGVVTVIFITSQRFMAEAAFAKAVRLDRQDAELTQVIKQLDKASTSNRFNDVYYRNLSQALLLQVASELQTNQVQQMSPERRKYIQDLTGASINSTVRATQLSGHNVLNWLVRGAMYREFLPLIDNAGGYAIESFVRATELEPINPDNFVELGKTRMLVAEQLRPLSAAEDPQVKLRTNTQIKEHLAKAEVDFLRAIELKPDYASAHYQLGLVYDALGRIDEAVGKMESVAQYNPLDVGVAFQLGMLYLRRNAENDLERARLAFEHAIGLVPSYSNARWFLASIYEEQDNFDAAIEQVAKVLELNSDNSLAQARLKRLQEGKRIKELPPPLEEEEENIVEVPRGLPTKE